MAPSCVARDMIWYLGRTQIFSLLPREELVAFKERFPSMTNYKRGDSIEWGPGRERLVYVVKAGSVRITTASGPGGRETLLALLGHAEIFGQMPLLEAETRPCKATALEDSLICEFPADALEQLLAAHPDVLTRMTVMYGMRLRKMEHRVASLLFKDARQRVAYVLLELLGEWGVPHPAGGRLLDVRVTHQDIASLAGLTRETVSLTLAEFDLAELLRTIGRKIVILDADGLRLVADGPAAAG
jgi:CRP/FNR family transcriptional regulator